MKRILCTFLFLWSMLCLAQNDSTLTKYTKQELLDDYDLMVSSLKEAHSGLYWYTGFSEYEKIFKENRDKIYEGMNSYEFFRILCLVTAADREGHSSVNSSKEIGDYFRNSGRFLPFGIKRSNGKMYLINDVDGHRTKGKIIKSINGLAIDSILKKIFAHTSSFSDGFTTTGKFKSMDRYSFSSYYFDFFHDFKKENAALVLIDLENDQETKLVVPLVSRDRIFSIAKTAPRKKNEQTNELFKFKIEPETSTGILTFNSFHYGRYERENLNFKEVVDSLFRKIENKKVRSLIIDVRNNSGGSEGAEDYLFSYLSKDAYKKYEYVETKGLSYSFIAHTDYKEDTKTLYDMLQEEHYLSKDGRYLRKATILPTQPPQENPFLGDLYILISGRTYSGGSEFASIAKSQERAVFVGEETGGGFYGQTSGSYVYLSLPNSKMKIRIPLLKFSTTFKSADIPFGRGVIPNYEVEQTYAEYEEGIDVQLKYTMNLIQNKE